MAEIEEFVASSPSSPLTFKKFLKYFSKSDNVPKTIAWAGSRIRKVNKYEFLAGNGKYKVDTITNDLSNFKIKTKRGILPKEVSEKLPIPTTVNCKLVGAYRSSVPGFRGKIVRPSPAANFVRSVRDFDDKLDPSFIFTFPGDFQYNSANLVTMGQPSVNKLSYDRLLSAIDYRGGVDLHLPKMESFDSSAVRNVRVNPKAFSGLQTSKMFGYRMRDSVKFTKSLTERLWKSCIRDRLRPDVSLWAVGGREKHVNIADCEFKPRRTRLVLQCEDSVKLLGNAVLQPFTSRLTGLMSGSFMIGRSMEDFKFDEFYRRFNCDSDPNFGVIDADWSQFDNYVYEELIVSAFGVIRSCYPEGKEIDNYFLYQCGSMVFKNVVLPESKLIYRLSKGLPSGHPYTSVVGSIINWLLWSVGIVEALNYQRGIIARTQLAVMGDDTLLKYPYGNTPRLEKIMMSMGMKIDSFVHRHGPLWSLKKGSSKTFLKKVYQFGLLSWDYQSICNNLSTPLKGMSIEGQIQRVRMLMYTAPFPSDSTSLLTKTFFYLVNKSRDENTHDPPVVRDLIHSKLTKGWNISCNIAVRWFVGTRDYKQLGFRQDEWDTRTVYITDYDNLPSYCEQYSRYIMFGEFG